MPARSNILQRLWDTSRFFSNSDLNSSRLSSKWPPATFQHYQHASEGGVALKGRRSGIERKESMLFPKLWPNFKQNVLKMAACCLSTLPTCIWRRSGIEKKKEGVNAIPRSQEMPRSLLPSNQTPKWSTTPIQASCDCAVGRYNHPISGSPEIDLADQLESLDITEYPLAPHLFISLNNSLTVRRQPAHQFRSTQTILSQVFVQRHLIPHYTLHLFFLALPHLEPAI